MTEKKYIDAEAWLKQCNPSWMNYNLAQKIIREAPVAEVVGQWIEAAEHPPRESGEYIVMIEGAAFSSVLLYDAAEKVFYEEDDTGGTLYRVTHWMSKPEPPRAEAPKKPNVCKCRSCGAEIIWVMMQSGKRMPCDAKATMYRADPAGKESFVTEHGLTMRGTADPDGDTVGYISHFTTCPQAESFRGRGKK